MKWPAVVLVWTGVLIGNPETEMNQLCCSFVQRYKGVVISDPKTIMNLLRTISYDAPSAANSAPVASNYGVQKWGSSLLGIGLGLSKIPHV